MKIILALADKTEIELEVPVEDIAERAILVHNNKFYTYERSQGRAFGVARFGEVKEPLYLN